MRDGSRPLDDQVRDDVQLVQRLVAGDDDALDALYLRYGKLVYSIALRIVRDSTAAEDLTQDVFVRLWRSAASFQQERGSVQSWLMRITHNLALNEVRRRQSRPVADDHFDWDVSGELMADLASEADPPQMALFRERSAIIMGALAQLPATQRQAIEMAYFAGLSQAEIATALGEPLGTVKSRIRIGMQRLRELLVKEEIDAQL